MTTLFGAKAQLPIDAVGGVAGKIGNAGGSEGGPLTVHGTPILTGTVGTPYAGYTLTATGGISPYSFYTSALPAGLSLDPVTGVVSGTPTTAGVTAGIINRVIDAIGGHSDLAPFTITISGGGPTPTWSANFATGVYTLGGAPSSLAAIFTQDTDWGNFDTANVVGGTGLEGSDAGTSAPVLHGAALTDALAGATYVMEFTLSDAIDNIEMELNDLPAESQENGMSFNNTALDNVFVVFPGSNVLITNVPAIGAHKVAFNITDTQLAISLDGGAVQTLVVVPSTPANAFGLVVGNNGAGSTPFIKSLTAYVAQSTASLPGLST